jgi:hypothetical protein
MSEGIEFIAEFEDGTLHHFRIDEWTLKQGDHVARLIAAEHFRNGKIKDVRRAPAVTLPDALRGGSEAPD